MPRGTLEIIEFEPRRMAPAAASASTSLPDTPTQLDVLSQLRLRYRAATSMAAALTVLVLHVLVLAPVLWGGSAAHEVERFGTPNPIQAVLIDDQSGVAITPPAPAPPLLQPVSVNLAEIPARKTTDPGLAALYGRYLEQIHARIDRAWLRPRTAIGADIFRCEVEIGQRRDGIVETVTLRQCNGTVRWQQSLVRGIEEASPIPAPPDPAVFAGRVVLHFEAVAYVRGRPAQNFEPMLPVLAADNEATSAVALIRSLRQPTKGPHALSVIELRIRGSRIEVEPQR